MSEPLYAEVILPLALPRLLTYEVPEEMAAQVQTGCRVVVPLGQSKLYTGIVSLIHKEAPGYHPVRRIQEVVDHEPVLVPFQLPFWKWMASYYLCTPGEVMNGALPSGLKLTSEARISRNEDAEINPEKLSDREYLIMEALEVQPELSLSDVSKIIGIKTIHPFIKSLQDKGFIHIEKEVKQKYKPKTEIYIGLSEEWDDEDRLRELLDGLTRAPRQMEIIMNYIRLSNRYVNKLKEISKKTLLHGLSEAPLRELIKKGVFYETKVEIGRIPREGMGEGKLHTLSEAQESALQKICEYWKEKDVVLLHGVTSSGKTEIYARLIKEQVDKGNQVLFLLPEIALTTQLIERLRKIFPGHLGVYHSRFNDQERVEIWNQVKAFEPGKQGAYQVILGARSALFLPFTKLGLIIVDEEHDSSYKQQEPAPRYHGRDSAIFLASQLNAKVLLGSATPSFESYHNALENKYGLVKLPQRYGNVSLPETIIVNISQKNQSVPMQAHFSLPLAEFIKKALLQREQVILFQNRRGFSLMTQCQTCGWVPQCRNCDISLTYHKSIHSLKCHYCGFTQQVPVKCPSCGGMELKNKGFGTEKVEEEMAEYFPEALTARMDIDTTRRKHSMEEILRDFADGAVQVLIGTQMITKGLDFENVSTVGVLNADNLLYYPDFRAFEKAYQLLTQVSGRAGRRNKTGRVIIQTYIPDHFVIQSVIRNDYEVFYRKETEERNAYGYPPFTRIIHIRFRHRDFDLVKHVAHEAGEMLKKKYPGYVLGPEIPSVSKIKNQYYFRIMIKIPKTQSVSAMKSSLLKLQEYFKADPAHRSVEIIYDVDPY